MWQIAIHNPGQLVIGNGKLQYISEYFSCNKYKRLYVIVVYALADQFKVQIEKLSSASIKGYLDYSILNEPDLIHFIRFLTVSINLKTIRY